MRLQGLSSAGQLNKADAKTKNRNEAKRTKNIAFTHVLCPAQKTGKRCEDQKHTKERILHVLFISTRGTGACCICVRHLQVRKSQTQKQRLSSFHLVFLLPCDEEATTKHKQPCAWVLISIYCSLCCLCLPECCYGSKLLVIRVHPSRAAVAIPSTLPSGPRRKVSLPR